MTQRSQRDRKGKAFLGYKCRKPGFPKGQIFVCRIEIREVKKGEDSWLGKERLLEMGERERWGRK